jgi:ABC-type transport system involved in multi-copper enzyme maturation permease subunit
MISRLIIKEIMIKVLDLRFIISTLIVLLLVIFSVVMLSENHMKAIDDYQVALQDDQSSLEEVKVFSFLEPRLHYPPNPLAIFNTGISDRINKTITFNYSKVPRQSHEVISENPLLKIHRHFDLTFVFRLVLSLLAIILVYDAFSGEKETGTLKLMLSNGVRRSQLLAGKLVSNTILLTIPVLLSFLFSLIIITTVYGIGFNMEQWFRIGLIILTTIVFLQFFIALGLMVSSLTVRSSVSLIVLTSLWVILCVLQPNLGSYIASSAIDIPSNESMEDKYLANWNEFTEKQEVILEQIKEKIPPGRQNGNVMNYGDHSHCYAVLDGSTPMLMRYLYKTMEVEPIRHQYAEREWNIYLQQYLPLLIRQQKLQNTINYASPAALLQSSVASLSRTDIEHYDLFLESARSYRSTLMNYLVNDRKIFSDNAHEYFTRLDREEVMNSRYEERERTNSSHGFYNTAQLDLTGIPEYTFHEATLEVSIVKVLLGIMFILIYTGIIALITVYSFRKYDAR